jgi:hypothetical protein
MSPHCSHGRYILPKDDLVPETSHQADHVAIAGTFRFAIGAPRLASERFGVAEVKKFPLFNDSQLSPDSAGFIVPTSDFKPSNLQVFGPTCRGAGTVRRAVFASRHGIP